MYTNLIKQLLDITISFIGIVLLSPVILILLILLSFSNKGKPFFTQLRPGKNTELFKVIKFKTMNDKRDVNGNLLPDTERLTTIGKFVRKTSLDELPQLINVLKGDMSLIGPRPLLVEYLPIYNKTQQRRHEVRPGITGWAQVNGRNAISWENKFELDIWYVDNISFTTDIKILLLTLRKVFISEGINQEGEATSESFKGSRLS
jgi:undecaprenyl phosphate N,N'-diacetylbacillosamine 1-phosphate transferase